MLEQVLDIAARGWSIFPIRARGKNPLTAHGYKDATTDSDQIKKWWQQWPNANVGIACGESDLLVLDIDGPEGKATLEELGVEPIETVTVRTGKGRHFYFQSNGKDYKNTVAIKPGLDIRTTGGSVVAPPSIHKNGKQYVFLREEPLAEIPPWLEELLAPFERESHTTEVLSHGARGPANQASTDEIPEGMRNTTLATIGGWLRSRGYSQEEILPLLLAVNRRRSMPKPLPENEVRSIAESVSQYELGADLFKHTDVGNAERLVHYFGNDFRFCFKLNTFFVWNGKYWEPDEEESIIGLARQTTTRMYDEAYALEDEKGRKALSKWALTSQARNRLVNMVELAKGMVPIKQDELDADEWLLCVINGVLDLRTGELRDFRREDYITKRIPAEFDAEADCPKWRSFLLEVMSGNEDLCSFLQRAIGYSLTGSIREQCLFILHGGGANGKSTFIDVMLHLAGDYGMQTQPQTIMLSRRDSGSATPELAALPGVRLLSTVETAENRRLNESLIKQLTGGDRVSARKLYADFFQFIPQFKLWLASNHLPTIQGTDLAIWRRIRKVPFLMTIPPEDQDRDLPVKLRDELPGILNWAVRGCLEWQKRGLDPPLEVIQATNEYRGEMDVLADFLDECVDEDAGMVTTKADLYQVYETWCNRNGEKAMTQRSLGTKLKERGYTETRTKTARCWTDIAISMDWAAVIAGE